MTKKLIWRLGKLPTPEELRGLVNDKIITQDEAREILFNQTEEGERTIESYQEEVKFLKLIIEKLGSTTKIVETIRYVEKPYYKYPWYTPYSTWCAGAAVSTGAISSAVSTWTGSNGLVYTNSIGTNNQVSAVSQSLVPISFSSIKS